MDNAEVLLEKISNLHNLVFDLKTENKVQHEQLKKSQNYTNGKVRALQVWKGTIVGALGVIIFLSSFFIKDYVSLRDDHSMNVSRLNEVEKKCNQLK